MAQDFRADHIGSLLRPPEVLEARAAHNEGRVTAEQLKEIEDKAILNAIEMQRQVGINVFSDGEYRRSWFSAAFADSIGFLDNDARGRILDVLRKAQAVGATPAKARAAKARVAKRKSPMTPEERKAWGQKMKESRERAAEARAAKKAA